ncbi:MAG: phosphopyruvate hydratase [Actinomycetota bacterium]|nr:phosphopyruvate hydratase [Actinomycetota bacterium]
MSSRIATVEGWEALDSRGDPTVGCRVTLVGGAAGVAITPSGASRGTHEAWELRDGDERYGGLGVRRAVENVREILAPGVIGRDAEEQDKLDSVLREIDGTSNLARIGANAVLAVSVASALAAAKQNAVPFYRWIGGDREPLLPMPMINVLSGRAHGGALDLQDFLIVPVGASSFPEAIESAWRVRRATAELIADRALPATLVADEGGLGPPLTSARDALDLLESGIERAGLVPGDDMAIAVDVAASQLAVPGGYRLAAEGRVLDREQLLDEVAAWSRAYPIVSLEDPLAEDDWTGWVEANKRLGGTMQLLGDDLFATNVERLERGIELRAANAVLVKPNQTGTLSSARKTLLRARDAGLATVVSARSGDTEEAWLADLAVGWQAGQIKVGSLTRSERTAKWNRLLAIAAEAGETSAFAGRRALAPYPRSLPG